VKLTDVGGGVRLAVHELGAGPPVVLVAGFGMDSAVWDRQVRLLTPAHRVVCVDQRGHGGSDAPLSGYDVDSLAVDLRAVLLDLGVTGATVVGWSFGGQVAFRLAVTAPELVARLVLVGSNAVRASRSAEFPFGPPAERAVAALVAAEHADRLAARRATVASGFRGDPDPALLDWLVGRSLQMPSWAAVACYASMLTADQVGDVAAVVMPVLQVLGADDPVHTVEGARWLAERLPDSRLEVLPACGHYPMYEAADAFDAVLTPFVDGASG